MSTPTDRNRLEQPDYGAAEDQWGFKLNTNFKMIDQALDGVTIVDVSTGHALDSDDYAEHEALSRILKVRGFGLLTVPAREKYYIVIAQDNFTATDGTDEMPVRAGISILTCSPLAVHQIDASAFPRVAVFTDPATIDEPFGLYVLSADATIAIPTGSYIDVRATAEARVGGFTFQAGASGRLVRTATGYVLIHESEGVS